MSRFPFTAEHALRPGGVDVPKQSEHLTSENPCVRTFGARKANAHCGDCARYRQVTIQEGTCVLVGQTATPRASLAFTFPACKKFKAKPKFVPPAPKTEEKAEEQTEQTEQTEEQAS